MQHGSAVPPWHVAPIAPDDARETMACQPALSVTREIADLPRPIEGIIRRAAFHASAEHPTCRTGAIPDRLVAPPPTYPLAAGGRLVQDICQIPETG